MKPRQWQASFDGTLGLKQGYAITNMPPSSCLDIKNMYLNGLGGKSPRLGYLPLFYTSENRLTTGTVTGTPVVESTLSQAVSGATGRVKELGAGYLVLSDVVGTFDFSHLVTGLNPDLNGTSGKIVLFDDYSGTVAGTVRATTLVAHGLPAGTSVLVISGTTNYNGTFTVTRINATTFYFTDTYVADEYTGFAQTTFTFTPSAYTNVRLTNRVRSLLQFSPQGGTVEQLAYSGTKIFKQNGTTTSVVRGGLTNNKAWEWLQYRDRVLGVNGSNTSLLYNGTSYTTISITPPASNVTYTDVGGGALSAGTYEYLITFYDGVRESNPALFPATSPTPLTVGAAGKVTITSFPMPVMGEGATQYRIYRRRPILGGTAAETIFTFLVSVPISTTSYSDNDNVTGTIAMEYDTGQPDEGNTPHPASDLICEAFDRVFMVDPTDPSILVYSRKGEYHAYPSGNYFYIGRGDGSRIVRLEKHGEGLLIHKKNGWYILTADPDEASPAQLSKIGTQDIHCSVSAQNQVVRLSTSGFYRAVPTEYAAMDLREDYIGQDIADWESNLDWANSQYINSYNYNAYNRRHVYFIQPALTQSGTPLYYSHCWVFDIVLSQWVYYEIGTDVFSVADYVDDNRKYMMLGDGYGIVWQWDLGDSDGSALSSILLNGTMTSGGTTFQDTTKVDVNSTATSGGANTLKDTTQTWTTNQWAAKPVYIVAGTGAGQTNVVLSNTSNELTLSSAWTTPPDNTSVYTVGGWVPNQLIGCVVSTWAGAGALQKRRVISNTSYAITVDAAWADATNNTTEYSVAAIEQFAEEYWDSNGDPHIWKRMRWVVPYVRQTGNYLVEISFRKDFSQTYDKTDSMSLASAASTWGYFLWGSGSWGGRESNLGRLRFSGKYHYYSIRYRNRNAAEPLTWDGHGAVFQVLYDRNK